MREFSKRLKELRAEKGLSLKEVEKLTGISDTSISRWEMGKSEPGCEQLIILAKFFHISVDYLLGLVED